MLRYIVQVPLKSPCTCAPIRWFSKPSSKKRKKQQLKNSYKEDYQQNPGLQGQLSALNLDNDVEDLDLENFDLEEFEADFMEADKHYDEHMRDKAAEKRKIVYKMVERKHFRPPKEPNLLTWAEKEQIRYLHQQDPNEWHIERLSESFPATPAVIKKILKSQWMPFTDERVIKHDATVEQNWKLLAAGEIPFTPQVQQLLQKGFKERKPLPAVPRHRAQSTGHLTALETYRETPGNNKMLLSDKVRSSEFGGILYSYYNRLEAQNVDKNYCIAPSSATNYKLNHSLLKTSVSELQHDSIFLEEHTDTSTHNYTLEKYREKVLKQLATTKVSNYQEQEAVCQYQSWLEKQQEKYKTRKDVIEEAAVHGEMVEDIMKNVTCERETSETGYIQSKKYKEAEMLAMKVDSRSKVKNPTAKEPYIYDTTVGYQRPFGMVEEYPDRIHIPESSRQEGRLYKVGDRYYDENGDFLYRVPGMEN